jgi:hypothetical protein
MVSLLLDELTMTKDLEGLPIDLVVSAIIQHKPQPLATPRCASFHSLLDVGINFSPLGPNGNTDFVFLNKQPPLYFIRGKISSTRLILSIFSQLQTQTSHPLLLEQNRLYLKICFLISTGKGLKTQMFILQSNEIELLNFLRGQKGKPR